jgi:hypothetical protein
MDEEIEEFRDEVVQWRGPRRQGAHPYPAAMKAKALRLAARLRTQGLTASAAAKLVGITAITLEGWQKAPGRGGWVDRHFKRPSSFTKSHPQ